MPSHIYRPHTDRTIRVLDPDGTTVLARILAFESFEWCSNWLVPDTWSMRISAATLRAHQNQIAATGLTGPLIGLGTRIVVQVAGRWVTGLVSTLEFRGDGSPFSETVEITGSGLEAIARQRICMYAEEKKWNRYSVCTGTVEHCARLVVDRELIRPPDARRAIPGLELEPSDEMKGPTYISRTSAPTTVEDALEAMARYSRLSFKIRAVIDDSDAHQLCTGTGVPKLQFQTIEGRNLSNRVKLSPDNGTIRSYELADSIAQFKNLAIVIGRGVGSLRPRQPVYLGPDPEPTGLARYETGIEATDCFSPTSLQHAGHRALRESQPTISLSVEVDPESPRYRYGTEYAVGDTVRVQLPHHQIDAQIISAAETWDSNGSRSVKLTIGNDPVDIVDIVRTVIRRCDGFARDFETFSELNAMSQKEGKT